jgi:hypothetical protein
MRIKQSSMLAPSRRISASRSCSHCLTGRKCWGSHPALHGSNPVRIIRATFDGHYRRLRSEILHALHDDSLCDHSKTAETCRRLSNECFSLFVFVHHHGVLPTNNAAEQALRKSVICRKLSFGSEQQTGSKNMSVILSVMETCRRINRSRLDFLRESIHAAFRNKPAPRLLPTN